MGKRELIVIRESLRTVRDSIAILLTESGSSLDIQDVELQDMYYALNKMSIQLTEKMKSPVTIDLEDSVPGKVIEPVELPEVVIPEDFDI